MVREIDPLKQAVHLDHPSHLWANIRADDGGRNLGMIHRRKIISQIVDQCGNNSLNVHAIGLGATCGLQGMLKTVDFVAV